MPAGDDATEAVAADVQSSSLSQPTASGEWQLIHDEEDRQKAFEKAEAAAFEALQHQRNAEIVESLRTPEKDPDDVTPQPPGPPETWPIAFMPDGEDVCSNGSVLKRLVSPGIAELGKPPTTARVRCTYKATTLEGREWDSSEKLHKERLSFVLGDLYVNRVLEAAVASMAWGESAEFVCTTVYAQGNNATTRKLPKGATCVRYEVTLVSWRAKGARDVGPDGTRVSKYEMSGEARLEEVLRLKSEAAPMVKHGFPEEARELYDDCKYYIDEWRSDEKGRQGDFEPPEGRDTEARAVRVSIWLNDAMCSLKLREYRRAEASAQRALVLEPDNVKALFRRGVARTHLHDHADALADLNAAAKLDPKSRDVREALAALKLAREAAKTSDTKIARKSIGSPARAPPGGGLRKPATLYFELAHGSAPAGRLVMKMFKEAPLTCENFRCLCTGERGLGNSGKPLHYKGCEFHRLIKGFLLQGGDIVRGDGLGGDSIYGGFFRDERFLLKHDRAGLLSMASNGPDTNTSQFFFTLAAAPHLDGKCVVFGEVVEGMDVLAALQTTVKTDERDRPTTALTIQDCGEIDTAVDVSDVAPDAAPLAASPPAQAATGA